MQLIGQPNEQPLVIVFLSEILRIFDVFAEIPLRIIKINKIINRVILGVIEIIDLREGNIYPNI